MTSRPSALSSKTILGHPTGLYVLFFAELWERFSYYGMRAILMLYMTKHLAFGTDKAGLYYGNYTGLVYLLPLLGGFLADRYLGLRKAIVLGGLLMAAGHVLLAVDDRDIAGHPFFIAALCFLIVGNGFFKPNMSTLVGKLYAPGDGRRDGGFTIFYMGVNIGAFLAPIVCGGLGESTWGSLKHRFPFTMLEPVIRFVLAREELNDDTPLWHLGFGAAAIGMLVGLLVFRWGAARYLGVLGVAPERRSADAAPKAPMTAVEKRILGGIVIGGLAIGAFLSRAAFGAGVTSLVTAMLWPAVGTATLMVFALLMLRCDGVERTRVASIFLIGFFVMLFWGAFEQAGSSLTLFADRHTELSVFGWTFGASLFQSVNPAAIILLGPLFTIFWTRAALRGKEPPTPIKIAIGLAFECMGFALLIPAALLSADGRVSPMWLTAAYTLQTAGELAISPVGLSMVTKLAPARFGALCMGVWFLSNVYGNKLGGVGASALATLSPATLFGFIVLILVAGIVLLLVLTPLLKRWMAHVR